MGGVLLAIGFVLLVRRWRSFAVEKRAAAVGLFVAALVYAGFGLFSGSIAWNLVELAGVAIYGVFAWLGLQRSGWFLVVGWTLHVAWDALLHDSSTTFVPSWYIGLCIGFDLALAGYIGFREIKK